MSESQALLQHDDSPTAILSRKLRSLMQYNALKQGYMPSTSQLEDHLASVIQSPLLNSRQRGLSRQTKTVLDDARSFVKSLGQLLKDKNEGDLVQELIWNLRGASIDNEIDGDIFSARLDAATAKADAKTAHLKAKAIADVLYSNPQFRALIHDGSILARDVLSDVVEATATAIAPEESDLIELEQEATDVDGRAIQDDVEDTKKSLNQGIETVKKQVKDTYDEATTAAIKTIRDMQASGQQFGNDLSKQASQAADGAKDTAQQAIITGSEAASQVGDKISDSTGAAITKIEELTGIKASDITSRLKQGVSIDDIIQSVKNAKDSASAQLQETAHAADQKGGQMLDNAKSATSDFVEQNNVEQKLDNVKEQGSKIADQAQKSAKSTVSTAQSKGKEAMADAKPRVQETAKNAKDTVEGASQANTENVDAKDTSNHLQELGIVHPSTNAAQENSSTQDIQNQAEQLLNQIADQIRSKVEGVQGISQDQVEKAARDLIDKSQKIGSELKQAVKEYSSEASDRAGQVVARAQDGLDQAKDKSAAGIEDAKQRGAEVASETQDKTAQIAQRTSAAAKDAKASASQQANQAKEQGQKASNVAIAKAQDASRSASDSLSSASQEAQAQSNDIADQIKNLDTTELQEAVNNLLRTAKNRLEEASGVSADDARKSLDWAIKRGEELAEQAMRKGREASEVTAEKSDEAWTAVKEKSAQIGEATQESAVAVGAQAQRALQNAPKDAAGQIHDTLDATQEMVDTAVVALQNSTSEIRDYLGQKFPPKRRQAIQKHFQGLAVALRDNSDYSNGLDGLISIGKKYVDYVLTFTEEIPTDPDAVVSTNAELDTAVRLTIQLLERFSGGVGFDGIQGAYKNLKKDMQKEKGSDDFLHDCMIYFKKIVQDMKYASSKDAEKHGHELLDRVDAFSEDTGFKQDLNAMLREIVHLAEGFSNDKVLFNVVSKGRIFFKHLVMNEYGNFVFKKRVMKDFINVILPSALKLVQYVPISRIEFQNADVDVLIENLVFESSASHDQSFLPYRLKIDNHNQVEFLNAYKFESDYSNQVTVKIQGLTLAVRDAGFYIRKKTGLFRFSDSGLVDLIMDGPGIDIDIDLAMSTDDEENDVTKDALFIVKDVRVHIKKLDFSTSGTKHGWIIGLVKPFIRGFIRRQVGLAVGAAIKDQLVYYEYQLRMLQHRIKTAYIANNGQASYESFFRAIFTANAGNNSGRKGQFEVAVGGQGPLAGIFTKASLQQELEDADAIADEHGRAHSWKNDIFDL